jgi:hypothetical protein
MDIEPPTIGNPAEQRAACADLDIVGMSANAKN